jgi:translation initiation factor eIF-2B subunit gamma
MVKSASLDDLVDDEDSQSSSPRSGGLGVWYPTKKVNPVKGEETDFVATVPLSSCSVVPPKGSLFPHLEKVVYSMPTDSLKDLIEEQKGYDVRQSLIEQYPRVKMLSTHRDAHIYIFPHWVMQFVRDNERFDSISEDVIGWWAKASWQKGLSTKLGLDKSLRRSSGDDDTDGTASPDATKSPKIDVDTTATDAPNPVVTAQENSSEDSNDSATPSEPVPVPPMVAYIHPGLPDGPLIRRVDTSQLLLQVSLQLAKLPALEDFAPGATEVPPFAHARKVAYPEGVKPRTTITRPDTLVGDNVTVQEKAHVKESVIGAGCQIGEGARLVQCLLMDGVVVGKNCKLTRCILGKRSEIGDGCVLTECEVQENLLVEAKSEFFFLVLVVFWFALEEYIG